MTQGLIDAAETGNTQAVLGYLDSSTIDVNYIGEVKAPGIIVLNRADKRSTYPGTALVAAIINQHWEIANLLLNHPHICVDMEPANYSPDPVYFLNPLMYAANHPIPINLFRRLLQKAQNLDPNIPVEYGLSMLMLELSRTDNPLEDRLLRSQWLCCEAVMRHDREAYDSLLFNSGMYTDEFYLNTDFLSETIQSRSFTVNEALIAKQGIDYLIERDHLSRQKGEDLQLLIDNARLIPVLDITCFPTEFHHHLTVPVRQSLPQLFIQLQRILYGKQQWNEHNLIQLRACLVKHQHFDDMQFKIAMHEQEGRELCLIIAMILFHYANFIIQEDKDPLLHIPIIQTLLDVEETNLVLTRLNLLYHMSESDKKDLLFMKSLEFANYTMEEQVSTMMPNPYTLFLSQDARLEDQQKQAKIAVNLRNSNCNRQICNGQGERINKIHKFNDKWVTVGDSKVCIRSDIDGFISDIEWKHEENDKNVRRINSRIYNDTLISIIFRYESGKGTISVRALNLLSRTASHLIEYDRNEIEAITLADNYLIALMNEKTIVVWDTSAKVVSSYPVKLDESSRNYYGLIRYSENYILYLANHQIIIINRKNSESQSVTLNATISNAMIDGNYLICSQDVNNTRDYNRHPHLILIDLLQGMVLRNIVLPDIHYPGKSHVGSIPYMVADKNRLFFILHKSRANLMMLDLKSLKLRKLSELNTCDHDHAKLYYEQGKLFFVAVDRSNSTYQHRAELWDISSQPRQRYTFQFAEMKPVCIQDVYCENGRFYFAYLRSILSYDFTVDHQLGEKLISSSDINLGDECRLL